MINYFKELLATLKSIDESLKEITSLIDNNNHRRRRAIRTSHWND